MDVSFPLSSLWSLSLPQKLFGRSHHPRVVTIANHHWREDTSPELLPPPHHWTAIVKAKRINAEGTYDSNTSLSHRFLPRKAPHIDSFTLFLTKELTHDNCSLSSSSLVKITHDSLSLRTHENVFSLPSSCPTTRHQAGVTNHCWNPFITIGHSHHHRALSDHRKPLEELIGPGSPLGFHLALTDFFSLTAMFITEDHRRSPCCSRSPTEPSCHCRHCRSSLKIAGSHPHRWASFLTRTPTRSVVVGALNVHPQP